MIVNSEQNIVGDKTFATRCDLCNVDHSAPIHAKSHYLGKRHMKEIKKHLDKLREEGQVVPNHGVKMGRGQDGPQSFGIGMSFYKSDSQGNFYKDEPKSESTEAPPAQLEDGEEVGGLTPPNNDEPHEEGGRSASVRLNNC